MSRSLNIGVLALQGAFQKHVEMLNRIGVKSEVIRYGEQLRTIDGLIIPGGESTTMTKIIFEMRFLPDLEAFDKPIFGTCAGAILLSETCDDPNIQTFKRAPVKMLRNAYGRQVDSFTESVNLSFNDKPFSAIFIRAPKITECSSKVEILGRFNGEIVLVRYRQYLLSTFHPELKNDPRIHEYFIEMVKK
ncbi:MAG: pyridoxal 5'-phosphate synthase glutaminase subunit PdxT [Candidatus Marinimicrobia bacterium CG08_land_8_20_14_0_20_45_22]|nr:MAG: pyridoxal 5'-phosphate synthase glutaminase subunit PdxT [Candidatus Marinimicrobia bacterium CG08_land_8_20_14_0_20_45_22]